LGLQLVDRFNNRDWWDRLDSRRSTTPLNRSLFSSASRDCNTDGSKPVMGKIYFRIGSYCCTHQNLRQHRAQELNRPMF
jgi:hypothetical protein